MADYLDGDKRGGARASIEEAAGGLQLKVVNLREAMREQPSDRLIPPRTIKADDISSYFCTGGTTGAPKIAVRTHRNEVFDSWAVSKATETDGSPGTVLCGLPLFHVNGQLVTGLQPWMRGDHVVIATPEGYRGKNVIARFWEIVSRYRITMFSGVPTFYAALMQTPVGDSDISSLRFAICGAAPMPAALIRAFEAKSRVKILEGYGLTEGRLTRERGTLLKERIQHTNRVKGLLSGQGVRDYNPLRRDRFERLEALRTGDGRELPPLLKAEIRRELDRIAVVETQLAAVERARDALVRTEAAEEPNTPAALLLKLKGIGPEFASLLWLESLFRSFGNRRQVAAYGGLAPSPWQSGGIERDQGISKSGNRRLRKTMIELAWFWVRHQPDLALSRWFRARVGAGKGRIRRIAIVALARKLLVALWRYVTQGVVPEGAVLKAA